MPKHDSGYARVPRDHYPTPDWVINALGEHVALAGQQIWEPAAGSGLMVKALGQAGATVHATDVARYGRRRFGVVDFLTEDPPRRFDGMITNPPFGERGKLAEQFISRGMELTGAGAFDWFALLLPNDFDSAKSRRPFFADCTTFRTKVVLTKRIVWFQQTDTRAQPKENHSWFVWSAGRSRLPVIRYAPSTTQQEII